MIATHLYLESIKNRAKLLVSIFLVVGIIVFAYEVVHIEHAQSAQYQDAQALIFSQQQTLLQTQQELQRMQIQLRQTKTLASVGSTGSISTAIGQWGPVVPSLRCSFADGSGQSGSGTLLKAGSGDYMILTNKHVVQTEDSIATSCSATFPGKVSSYVVGASSITVGQSGSDIAMLRLASDSYLRALLAGGSRHSCIEPVKPGDSIVVLGYPSIGVRWGVTATEGIIAGEEGDFYVTSAKVERGNSGGAAISVAHDCFLGTPTFVESGSLESLARILKWQSISSVQHAPVADAVQNVFSQVRF